MITRRTVLKCLASAPGGAAAAPVLASLRSLAAVQALPAAWLMEEATGRFWPVGDVHGWIDRYQRRPILAEAQLGLEKTVDPDRRLRLVLRRCHLACIDVLRSPDAALGDSATTAPGPIAATVRIQHWRADTGDLRPFFQALGLARSQARVQMINRKHEATTWRSGADFLYGEPLAAAPNIDELLARWQRRHEPKPPDRTLATTQEWWWCREPNGERQHGIPWAVLEAAWRDTPPFECPNCGTPTILSGFGWKRVSFFGFDPRREFVCPTCRRRHVATYEPPPAGWVGSGEVGQKA